MRRISFHSLVLGLAFVLAGIGAADASAVCKQLESQLINTSWGHSSSARNQRYADAVTEQNRQIRKVRTDLDRYRCSTGSVIVLGGQNPKACARLVAVQTKMRANLAALERKRKSFSTRDNKLARRRIQAALKANNCHGKRPPVLAAALRGQLDAKARLQAESSSVTAIRGNSGRIPPKTVARSASVTRKPSLHIVVEPKAARGGNYRTLCVRSCDGFFFPVSSAASPSDFARDERTCQMMCPGTRTGLFIQSAQNPDSAEMISVRTREPYTEMPNAFAYRNVEEPASKACGCNMAAFYKEMTRREAILKGTTGPVAPTTIWVRPSARPDPGEDPESIVNAQTRLSPKDVAAVLAASTKKRPLPPRRREVRMVGPAFLPDQDDDLNLKSGGQSFIR